MKTFEIHGIHYGWFQVCFTPHGEKQGWLTNSDYLGCDAPTLFLEALANILEKKTGEEWLCWQDEPGAYILRLAPENGIIDGKIAEKIEIEIFLAPDSTELPYKGAELASVEKKFDYKNSFEIKRLLDDVLVQFSLYENGNGLRLYEKHWDKFPKVEYHRLRKCAAEINNTLGKYDKMFCFEY